MDCIFKCTKLRFDFNGIPFGCGTCINCKKSKYIDWAIRADWENYMQDKGILLTLTYDSAHLVTGALRKMHPDDALGVLVPDHIVDFRKKVRTEVTRKISPDLKIKFFGCGEYGGETWRPHYHVIIWGIDFTDISLDRFTELWGRGFVHDGSDSEGRMRTITDKAIKYVVGYTRKKITVGSEGYQEYTANNRPKPFPIYPKGLGKEYILDHAHDLVVTGTTAYNGVQMKIPRYAEKLIYKSEGETVRFKVVKNIRDSSGKVLDTLDRWDYEVVKDVDAPLTSKLLQVKRSFQERYWKDLPKKLQGLVPLDVINTYVAIMKNKAINIRFENYKRMNLLRKIGKDAYAARKHKCLDLDIKESGNAADQRNKREEFKYKLLDSQTLFLAQQFAHNTANRILASPYGNRDGIEKSQLIA